MHILLFMMVGPDRLGSYSGPVRPDFTPSDHMIPITLHEESDVRSFVFASLWGPFFFFGQVTGWTTIYILYEL